MFGFFKSKSLAEHLRQGKTVRLDGIRFRIKKLDVVNYLEGAKILQEAYAVYRTAADIKMGDEATISSLKKSQSVLRDIIMSGVVQPKLVRKSEDDPEAICVDEILQDWQLANKLAMEIIAFTSGKKKK